MKKLFLTLVFILACNGKSCSKDTSTVPESSEQTSSSSVGGSVELPPTPLPPKEELNWKPFDMQTYQRLKTSNACSMFYFGTGKNCLKCDAEEAVLQDQILVKALNDNFVAIRYPVGPETDNHMRNTLHITNIPSILFIGPEKDNKSMSRVFTDFVPSNILLLTTGLPEFTDCVKNKKQF